MASATRIGPGPTQVLQAPKVPMPNAAPPLPVAAPVPVLHTPWGCFDHHFTLPQSLCPALPFPIHGAGVVEEE